MTPNSKPIRVASAVFPFMVLLGWMYAPVIVDMARVWYKNPNYSHGFLIPLVSGYFAWRKRGELEHSEIRPWNWGILVFLAGILMFLFGKIGVAHTTLRVSLIVTIGGIILFVCGKRIFWVFLFPYLYLLFMIPLPAYLYDAVAFPLKNIVAKYSVETMLLMNITVYRDGNIIVFPSVRLEVSDACSGIRSLYTLYALTVAYIALVGDRWWRRFVLIIAVVPVAVVSNGFRVIASGILAKYCGTAAVKGVMHDSAGIGVFIMMTFLVVLVDATLKRIGRDNAGRDRSGC